MTSNEELNKSLLRDLEVTRESGMRDSSMIDILEAVFCNIPDYVSKPIDEHSLNFNGNVIDTSVVYDQAERVIDSILNDPLPDFDLLTDTTNDNANTSGRLAVKKSYIRDVEAGDIESLGEIRNLSSSVKKSAIIEFGCETSTCPAVEFVISVKPGDYLNEKSIIGHVKQRGEWRPIRSIFSRGIVRKDMNGDYARLFSPVCTRHIIIDDYEIASLNNSDGSDISSLIEDPDAFDKFQKILSSSEEAINLIVGVFPYLMYIRLVSATASVFSGDDRYVIEGGETEESHEAARENEDEEDKDVEYETITIEDTDFGVRKIFVSGEQEDQEDQEEQERIPIEDEFSRWITERYEPRKDDFLREIEEIYGGFEDVANIKSTCGDPDKLKALASKVIEAREKFLTDVIDMIKNPMFVLPKKEKQFGERYWYTSRMKRKFSFKVLKTFLTAPLEETRDILEKQSQKTYDYDILNPSDREYDPVTTNVISKRSNIYLIEKEYTLREYFKNLASSTYYGGLTDLENELAKILLKYSKTHLKSGDARDEIEEELEELRSFFLKCLDIAGGDPSAEDQEETKRIKSLVNDRFLDNVSKMIVPEAAWPWSTDYEYRGTTYKKYTFPNIDCINPKSGKVIDYMTPEEASNIQDVIDNLKVPDVNSVNVNPGNNKYHDHGTDEGPGLTIDEVTIDDFEYWQRYLGIATMVGLIPTFWATGLILPSLVPFWQNPYLMLPCIFIPIKEVSISKCGLVIVFGLAIRGISISLLLIVANMNQQHNSLMFPATLLLADIRDQAFDQANSILDTVPMICNGISNSLKSNTVALLKQNKKYDAEIAGLKALKVPGANALIRGVKEELDIDPRMIVNRLESDIRDKASNYKASMTSAYSKVVSSFSAVTETEKETKVETT